MPKNQWFNSRMKSQQQHYAVISMIEYDISTYTNNKIYHTFVKVKH